METVRFSKTYLPTSLLHGVKTQNVFILSAMTTSNLTYQIMFFTQTKAEAVPLHTTEALGGRGGIAPAHSRPRQ
jgi:hypothetical protein